MELPEEFPGQRCGATADHQGEDSEPLHSEERVSVIRIRNAWLEGIARDSIVGPGWIAWR